MRCGGLELVGRTLGVLHHHRHARRGGERIAHLLQAVVALVAVDPDQQVGGVCARASNGQRPMPIAPGRVARGADSRRQSGARQAAECQPLGIEEIGGPAGADARSWEPAHAVVGRTIAPFKLAGEWLRPTRETGSRANVALPRHSTKPTVPSSKVALAAQLQVLRAHAQRDLVAQAVARGMRPPACNQFATGEPHALRLAVAATTISPLDEIHARRTDEARHKQVRGCSYSSSGAPTCSMRQPTAPRCGRPASWL